MSVLVLSPHRDDAAFSCGLLLAKLVSASIPLRIANVCTVSDYAPYANLANSVDLTADITRLRAAEDFMFAMQLQHDFNSEHQQVELLDLGWKDAPLRHTIATEDVLGAGMVPPDEVARLVAVFRSLAPARVVLAPLALGGHMDHRLVRLAAIDAWSGSDLVFYEDLPYACRMPAEERTRQTRQALPPDFQCAQTLPAKSGEKRRRAMCYPSQIAAEVADEMELYGAARGWAERLYGSAAALRVLASYRGTITMVEGNVS